MVTLEYIDECPVGKKIHGLCQSVYGLRTSHIYYILFYVVKSFYVEYLFD